MAANVFLLKRRISHFTKGYVRVFYADFYLSDRGKMLHNSPIKPPNVLLYHTRQRDPCIKSCLINFLDKCLPASRYVTYYLNHDRALRDPWMDNCQLLVIPADDEATKPEVDFVKKYIERGGKVMNFSLSLAKTYGLDVVQMNNCSCTDGFSVTGKKLEVGVTGYLKKHWTGDVFVSKENVINHCPVLSCQIPGVECTKHVAVEQQTEQRGLILHCSLPLMQYCGKDECLQVDETMVILMRDLLRHLGFEQNINKQTDEFSSAEITPCFLLCSELELVEKFLTDMKVLKSGAHVKSELLRLNFVDLEAFKMPGALSTSQIDRNEGVSLYYSLDKMDKELPMKFNWEKYCKSLSSNMFGKTVIYSDITSSTMDIAEVLVGRLYDIKDFCITCIARQQTKGKGRGGNKWLSPPGTAMLTIVFSVPLRSNVGQHLPILQHMMTVAVVHAIRSMPGLNDLDLRVKWPNDIYSGSSVKIGGVLVRSTMFRDTCIVTIGCGVNVDNAHPTKCVNEMIRDYGLATSLSCEEVLGRSISHLENIIYRFQRDGPKSFLDLYYKYWLHLGQQVTVNTKFGHKLDAVVIGIDEVGFLLAHAHDGNSKNTREIRLCPDDNSFDMMKNMIAMKERN